MLWYWWLVNIKFVKSNAEAKLGEQLVLLKTRRSLRVEQQVLQSYTGLKHFKFCYNLIRAKGLTRTKQVLPLGNHREDILLSPLPITKRLFLHLEGIADLVHLQHLPPFVATTLVKSWNDLEKSQVLLAWQLSTLVQFNTTWGSDFFAFYKLNADVLNLLEELITYLLFLVLHALCSVPAW